MRFTDKHVIVTGAGNGIGREYAKAFAKEGASVVVVDVDMEGAKETVREIESDDGRALARQGDVADVDAVASMVADASAHFGDIDVLVNNAGLHMGRFNETTTLEVAEWRRILDVNVIGALNCAAACKESMKRRGGGVIVNQSSSAAYIGAGGAYGVSKLALNGLTMALATELAPDGTRVVGIAPGMVRSQAIVDRLSQEHKELVMRNQLIKRFGEMEDMCRMVLFLSSGEASFITGQTFLVDGGVFPRS